MQVCPRCGSAMIMLFTSLACKDECDKNVSSGWKKFANSKLVYKFLKEGETVPKDAVYGWWVSRRSLPVTETDEELTNRVYKEITQNGFKENGGWPIEKKYLGSNELTTIYGPDSSMLMVTKIGS